MTLANPIAQLSVEQVAGFWADAEIRGASDCWLWKRKPGHKGYCRLTINGKAHPAHRVAYAIVRGDPARHLVVDHECRVRNCVNPMHLRAVTNYVNTVENSENMIAKLVNRSTCNKGHPLTDENNTAFGRRKGWRFCLICHNADTKERKRRARKRKANQHV